MTPRRTAWGWFVGPWNSAVPLAAGDMLLVEPGEPHTFLSSSPNYLHSVVQTPSVAGDKMDL
ncbi:hypothetical protein [Micromonospora globispora]|uniref:hypothetical protein n=1 Tax=Micromonospora globispora TaxID=1450148 RepID=UPI000F4D6656|nr:hypothetical protein [Micromonospora globispora]